MGYGAYCFAPRAARKLDPSSIVGGNVDQRRQQIEALEQDWAQNPRWSGVKRGYAAEDVVRLRGSLAIEHTLAKRGAEKLWKLLHERHVRELARGAHRQPGDAQVKAGVPAIYLRAGKSPRMK